MNNNDLSGKVNAAEQVQDSDKVEDSGDPGRTPGKAEGTETGNVTGSGSPGRTPGMAEGEDDADETGEI
jgi:hypothetical protein